MGIFFIRMRHLCVTIFVSSDRKLPSSSVQYTSVCRQVWLVKTPEETICKMKWVEEGNMNDHEVIGVTLPRTKVVVPLIHHTEESLHRHCPRLVSRSFRVIVQKLSADMLTWCINMLGTRFNIREKCTLRL